MKNREKIVVGLLILFFLTGMRTFSEERTENIDVFIVIDKSLSMIEEIDSVKEYVHESLFDKLLIPGDQIVVISFYGKTETVVNAVYSVTENDRGLRKKIDEINADGRFTDIGGALDALQSAVRDMGTEGRRRFLLLLTDGRQEAPPESKYYSPHGDFNHEMLENTKTIQKQGWIIHILGIGTDSAAEELAKELSAGYTNVPDVPEDAQNREGKEEELKEALERATEELVGEIRLISPPSVDSIPPDGNTQMILSLKSTGFSTPQKITIEKIILEYDGKEFQLLGNSKTITVSPEMEGDTAVPISFPPQFESGEYTGKVLFIFSGNTVFSPAYEEINFRVKAFLENNLFTIIAGGIILLVATTFLIILIRGKKREVDNKREAEERTV